MALPVYSTVMAAIPGLQGVSAEYGPQPGYAWIVRQVDATVEAFQTVSIGWFDSGGVRIWVNSQITTAPVHEQWQGWQVFPHPLFFYFDVDGPWDIRVSGYNLTLP